MYDNNRPHSVVMGRPSCAQNRLLIECPHNLEWLEDSSYGVQFISSNTFQNMSRIFLWAHL